MRLLEVGLTKCLRRIAGCSGLFPASRGSSGLAARSRSPQGPVPARQGQPAGRAEAARVNRPAIQQALSWLLLGGLLWSLFQLFQPFFDALAWAGVLAIFFGPLHRRVLRRIGRPNTAALVSTCGVTLCLIVPATLVVQALVREAVTLFNDSSIILPQVYAFFHRLDGHVPWGLLPVDSLQQAVTQASGWARANLASWSTRLAGNLAQTGFEVSLIIFALFYCFRDGRSFVRRIGRLSTMHERLQEHLLLDVADTVQVTVTALLLVSAVQGLLGCLIYALLGLTSPVVWGVMIALSSVVPVFGTALVWAPQGMWLLITGQTVRGTVLLLFGALVISTSDNLLRPLLITGRSQMNTLLVFIAVVGGIQAFGGVGAILGPVLLSAAGALLQAFDGNVSVD